eukprot:3554934-Amphidinium_carterae.1
MGNSSGSRFQSPPTSSLLPDSSAARSATSRTRDRVDEMNALLRPNLEENMHPPAKIGLSSSGSPKHRCAQAGKDGKTSFATS